MGLTVIVLTLCAMVIATATATAAPAASNCPAGSTYNKATKLCEREPSIVCPTGSAYNPETGLCHADATPRTCPEGYNYDSGRDTCTAAPTEATCPVGDSYDPARNVCVTPPITECVEGVPVSPGVCQDPVTGEPGLGRLACPEGYTYQDGLACEAPAGGSCPDGEAAQEDGSCYASPTGGTCDPGLSFDPSRSACVAVAQFACPQYYEYNARTAKCQTSPTKGNKKT